MRTHINLCAYPLLLQSKFAPLPFVKRYVILRNCLFLLDLFTPTKIQIFCAL